MHAPAENTSIEEAVATWCSVSKKPNVVFIQKLLRAFCVLFEAKIYNAANANVLQKRERLLGGVTTSIDALGNPAQCWLDGRIVFEAKSQ